MSNKFGFVIAFVLLFSLTGTALAQGPGPLHIAPTWDAAYWNNTTLSGAPSVQRSEADLDHNWGSGSPDPAIRADGFSARWSRYIDTTAGSYRFTATSDDGIRVWVDGDLIINQWNDHAALTFQTDRSLVAGHHLVTVEYYENGGGAVARVSWAPTPATITNWRGEYWNNTSLSGTPAAVRDDARINFNWGAGSPIPGAIHADGFSARWTRTVDLPAGDYRFNVRADDGVRLWVNGHLLIDAWRDQSETPFTGQMYLPGGAVQIKMEYYENGGDAVAQLSWSTAGGPPPSNGAVVVDDTDSGFSRGGLASAWRTASEGYGGRLTWTRNNDIARPNYNWARWYPRLNSGTYEVMVYVPDRYSTTSSARYWVAHTEGYTLRVVDQDAQKNDWVSLGVYRFAGNRNDYVSLSDITYETRLTRLIAFDAVQFVPR